MSAVKDFKVEIITKFTKQYLEEVYDIASKEGWHEPLEEFQRIHNDFGEFMWVALNCDGQVLGHIYAQEVCKNMVNIDLVMVHQNCRRRGIGTELMNHVMGLYPGYEFTLTPFEGKNDFYYKFGFQFTGHQNFRAVAKASLGLNLENSHVINIQLAKKFDAIGQYAESIFGPHVKLLISCMSKDPLNTWFAAMVDGTVTGYIVFKEEGDTCKVRSICADSVDIATALLVKCVSYIKTSNIFTIAYPMSNENCKKAYEHIFNREFEWSSKEDMLSTNGLKENTLKWGRMYGLIQYVFTWP